MVIILAGYRDNMEEFFDNNNVGLRSRFNAADPFVFNDYSEEELKKIFTKKCAADGIPCTIAVRNRAVSHLILKAKVRQLV